MLPVNAGLVSNTVPEETMGRIGESVESPTTIGTTDMIINRDITAIIAHRLGAEVEVLRAQIGEVMTMK